VDVQKGRVAVVSAASSFTAGSIPMDEDAEIRRVPGSACCERRAFTHTVTAKEMAVLEQMDAVRKASGLTITGNAGGRGGVNRNPEAQKEVTVLDRPIGSASDPAGPGR
jgi:hypothetical protein